MLSEFISIRKTLFSIYLNNIPLTNVNGQQNPGTDLVKHVYDVLKRRVRRQQ